MMPKARCKSYQNLKNGYQTIKNHDYVSWFDFLVINKHFSFDI